MGNPTNMTLEDELEQAIRKELAPALARAIKSVLASHPDLLSGSVQPPEQQARQVVPLKRQRSGQRPHRQAS
jgi:hypothetical protein